MNDKAQLFLKAEGEAFEGGKYDLRKVDAIISNYRLILDHSLPLVVGRQNLTEHLKSQFVYEVEFRRGSLELLINLVFNHKEALGALSVDGGIQVAEQIAKIIKGVIKFRRAWSKLMDLAEGKGDSQKPGINLNINLNDVTVDNGSTINVNPIIIPAAETTRGAIDRLISSIDGTHLEYVEIRSAESETKLTSKDVAILGTQKQELPSTVDILGRLYEINFASRKGLLTTSTGRVPVTWDESILKDIHQLANKDNIAFTVRPIVDHRRFKDAPIAYHVLRCWQPQHSLGLDKPKRSPRK